VGEVTSEGIEVDIMAQPTENLSLFGGVAFIDAQIDSYENGPCSFGQQFRGAGYKGQASCGGASGDQDLSGADLPFSPDWKVTLAANYVIPLAGQSFDIILKGNFLAQDDVQLSVDQDRYQKQDAYEILDLSVMLRDKDDRYSASLFVKNATDEHHVYTFQGQHETIMPNGYYHYLPRTFERRVGVELRYNWY
jgi:iron complex outermembrane receptor protein